MMFMNQQKKCSELFVPYMKLNHPVKDPFSPAFQSFLYTSSAKCGLQLNPNSQKTFITLRYDILTILFQHAKTSQHGEYPQIQNVHLVLTPKR